MGRHRSRYRLMTVYFVSGNAHKFREIQAIIPEIEQLKLDLDEIQSLDPQIVIEHKLAQAAAVHDGEFIVDDTSLSFGCLNGLPGTQIKWFLEALGDAGLAGLVHRYGDHSAVARVTIGYRDASGHDSYFVGEVTGTIVAPRGNVTQFGWNAIFQPNGQSLTFAEMTLEQKSALSMRGIATRKLASALNA
jgi:non-canonical purine NTP pyrophosphatase (RdgB/HAM1 family)